MVLDDINGILGAKIIHLNYDEALLLDWLLTLHSYDSEIYRMLLELMPLKEEIGKVLLNEKNQIEISQEELERLIIICPITFRWGDSSDCGYSLKLKLFNLKINNTDIIQEKEEETAEKDDQPKTDNGDA